MLPFFSLKDVAEVLYHVIYLTSKYKICFVDYKKAFDRVDWKKLMNALRRIGVDWKDRRLIGNLYIG